MNYYEWTLPGFYADGKIILAGESLEECLERLKEKNFSLWKIIQNGIFSDLFKKDFKKYALSQVDSDVLKNEINSYRDKIVNDERNGIACVEFHRNASNYSILETEYWQFEYLIIKDFLESNLVDGKTPWFIEPKTYDMDNIFYFGPAD